MLIGKKDLNGRVILGIEVSLHWFLDKCSKRGPLSIKRFSRRFFTIERHEKKHRDAQAKKRNFELSNKKLCEKKYLAS
jgi:predicted HicB family RNase H-like nuclease